MLDNYPKEIMTKNGTPIIIRPLVKEDKDRFREFLTRIPDEERWFIRDDMADLEAIHSWIENLDYSRTIPLVAAKQEDGTIVGNVRLQMRLSECLSHVAHLRIIVDPAYREQRLGTWMLIDTIKLAMDIGLEKLVAEFVAGLDEAAIAAAHRLDFFEQAVLRDYLKDRHGRYRDLVVMVKTVHSDWSDF